MNDYKIILKNSGKFNVIDYYVDKENPDLKGLKIGGVAITVGKHNEVNYTEEELKAITPMFIGKQLRADHSESIFDVLGKVTNTYWDEWQDEDGDQKGIKFEAIVTNEQVAKNIKMGVADGFSSAFGVKDIIKIDGEMYAKGLIPKELSHVCEPADERSRLTELYNSKQLDIYLKNSEEKDMVETKKLQEEPVAVAPVEDAPVEVTIEEVLGMIKELSDRLSAIEGAEEPVEPEAEPAAEPEKPIEEMAKKVTGIEKQLSELTKTLSKGVRKTVVTKEEPIVKQLARKDPSGGWVINKE